ncbi:MmcQ/YjbR family DNA-binding protein [Oerskovia sp. NPDC060287]|uniref:MmcQ/YjbR family DNA-binding protein n=1 Tax=Oerskovia sp. NPDC060287 TaxID=3347095 RepID=UPI00364EFE81
MPAASTPDDAAHLGDLRRLALAFPGAEERVSHGRVTFRARLLFAVHGGMTKATPTVPARQYPDALLVKVDPAEEAALAQDPRFFVPAYYGPAGWLGLDLEAAPVDWQEVAELLDMSYREVAGPRLVARLDAEGSPAGRRS